MDGLNGSLDGIINELTDVLGRAEWSRDQAQEALDKANAEVRRIKAILKAAGVEEEKPKRKEVKSGRVNEDTRAQVLKAIRFHSTLDEAVIPGVKGSFTAATIVPHVDVHEGSVRSAINNLRDDGIIRAVGLVPNSPRKAPMAYVLGEGNEASE
jgi:hypothetical protein